jgi:CTP:molybdopterin cytidylyltransferase MocA
MPSNRFEKSWVACHWKWWSIRIGVDADGILIMACDQWRLEKQDLFRLISCWLSDISGIVASSWNDAKATVFGPPVIFPGKLKPELLFVDGDKGARAIIDRHSSEVAFVNVDNAAFDIDEPEDLQKAISDRLQYPSN